jgi:PIN domain nuclease of toxin-antitoxin system
LRYLLDTCVFLWLCAAPKRLSPKVKKLFADEEAELILSDVAILEISLKWLSGKLELPSPPRSWVAEQARIWGTSTLPISRETVFRTSELPKHHRDPFDRLLVSAAMESSLAIVTPDRWIHLYPVQWIW